MKTFYLAAASSDLGRVQDHALDLISRGYQWHHDWTTAENWDVPDESLPALAVLDINAVRGCDVFVALAAAPSRGMDMEIGARLAIGKVAHVVGGDAHFFYNHPRIARHDSWNHFLTSLEV